MIVIATPGTPSTLSGSCSLFKQASNSILGSYPLHLSFSLSHPLPAFVHLIPSLNLSFSMSLLPFLTPSLCLLSMLLSHSLCLTIRLSAALRYRASVFRCPSLSLSAFLNSNPRTAHRDFNSCDNYLDFSCTALTAQSFHCNYLLVSTAPA